MEGTESLFGLGPEWGIEEKRPGQGHFPSSANQSEWITAACLLHVVLVAVAEVRKRFACISGNKRQKAGKQGRSRITWQSTCRVRPRCLHSCSCARAFFLPQSPSWPTGRHCLALTDVEFRNC